MSEGEQMGRLRREITAAYESTRYKPIDSAMLTADAIDRLAADVAAVREEVQRILPCLMTPAALELACDRHAVLCERDAAIRERDEWKEEARLAVVNRDEARAEVERLTARLGDRAEVQQAQLSAAFTEGTLQAGDAMRARFEQVEKERDEALAEVERLKAIVHSDAGHMAKILIENERLRAAPAAPQPAAPAAGWLTDEERRVLQNHAESLREQRFALERGGQTLGYSANPGSLKREADLIDAILARAGSPPVVEVPEEKIGCRHLLHRIYRDALDKAGVSWREVPRGQDLK